VFFHEYFKKKIKSNNRHLFIYFVYLQTANDGRPRPEEIIGNRKGKQNREAHTKDYKEKPR